MGNEIYISCTAEELQKMVSEAFKKEIKNLKTKPSELNDLIKASEVIRLLKISKPTLHKYVKNGVLNSYQLGTRVFFKQSEIMAKIISNKSKLI